MTPPPALPAAARALERELLDTIPLTRALGLRIVAADAGSLTLAAPLAANVNDKGCAFGGSLASLMTLAGWGLVRLALEAEGLACDIYVQDSQIRYLAPVWDDFEVVARPAAADALAALIASVRERGKGRLSVHCTVPLADGRDATTLEARFVAIARSG